MSGFTLAEVLITLGIIGVVVAMTLPALIADHREKQTVNQILTFYSKLSQATQHIIHDEGEPSVWLVEGDAGNVERLVNRYKKGMKVLTDCSNNGSACIAPRYLVASKAYGYNFIGSQFRYNLILQDGSSVSFFVETSFEPNVNNKNKKTYAIIYYDTNGVKPPNTFGYDMFQFALTDDGIYAYSDREFRAYVYPQGFYDSYWVITQKNLDFQRCPSEIKAGAKGCQKKRR